LYLQVILYIQKAPAPAVALLGWQGASHMEIYCSGIDRKSSILTRDLISLIEFRAWIWGGGKEGRETAMQMTKRKLTIR